VGHIDLLDTFSYFDVPERDARKVASQLTGIRFKGRQVRCNDADDTTTKPEKRDYQPERRDYKAEKRIDKPEKRKKAPFHREQNDWRDLMGKAPQRLKGEEPDFSEEGWARRRPKKK
jgi:ATP-dependent RNA helicase DeaD